MKVQNYSNHKKFYTPHHFVYLPILIILEFYSIYKSFLNDENQLAWILFSIVIFLLFYLAFMLRQHYALVLQDRMVKIEFKQRYFELFAKRSDDIENQLTFSQIAALRFAYDEEFKILLEKAIQEKLSGDSIKKSIKNWKPDLLRV